MLNYSPFTKGMGGATWIGATGTGAAATVIRIEHFKRNITKISRIVFTGDGSMTNPDFWCFSHKRQKWSVGRGQRRAESVFISDVVVGHDTSVRISITTFCRQYLDSLCLKMKSICLPVWSANDAKCIFGLAPHLVRFVMTKRILAQLVLSMVFALRDHWNCSVPYVGWARNSLNGNDRENSANLLNKLDYNFKVKFPPQSGKGIYQELHLCWEREAG